MLPSIAQLASKHGIIPLKRYGQNFIFDESLCDKIVKFSKIDSSSNVLEIGPGPAGLTRSILKAKPGSLCVIETDARCLPLLEEIKLSYPNLRIQLGDALKVPLSQVYNRVLSKSANEEQGQETCGAQDRSVLKVCEGQSAGRAKQLPSVVEFRKNSTDKIDIVANLPYNIGSVLLINWLCQIELVNSMTLMLQKEVVDRMVSSHNSKTYGRLSVFCQIFCEVEKCFDVSPKAFYPEPKIWSSIVRLVPKADVPEPHIRNNIQKITQAAFGGRRKMIKSSLGKIIPNIEIILSSLDLAQSLRAENLSPQDYVRIARAV